MVDETAIGLSVLARRFLEYSGVLPELFVDLISERKFIPLGREKQSSLEHRLVYVGRVDKFVVAVFDRKNGIISHCLNMDQRMFFGPIPSMAKNLSLTDKPLGLDALAEVAEFPEDEPQVLFLRVLVRFTSGRFLIHPVEYPLEDIDDFAKIGSDVGIRRKIEEALEARGVRSEHSVIAGIILRVGKRSRSCPHDFEWI